MFNFHSGRRPVNNDAIRSGVQSLSSEEIASVEHLKATLRDALNSFNARLETLPERERDAMLVLFYCDVTDKLFDLHLSIETDSARRKIADARTSAEKHEALECFKAHTNDLAMLYGVR